MKHTVVAMVEDRPGVLTRVASLFRRRGFNIDSLAVGSTEQPGISRMTIVVDGDDSILRQVEHQLYKLIDVVQVTNLASEDSVARELALIKVRCGTINRREVLDIVEIFRAQVIDVSPATLIIQVVAEEDRLNALLKIPSISTASVKAGTPASVRITSASASSAPLMATTVTPSMSLQLTVCLRPIVPKPATTTLI